MIDRVINLLRKYFGFAICNLTICMLYANVPLCFTTKQDLKIENVYKIGTYDAVSGVIGNQICIAVLKLNPLQKCLVTTFDREVQLLDAMMMDRVNYAILPLNLLPSFNEHLANFENSLYNVQTVYRSKLLPVVKAMRFDIQDFSDLNGKRVNWGNSDSSLNQILVDYLKCANTENSMLIQREHIEIFNFRNPLDGTDGLCEQMTDAITILSIYQSDVLHQALTTCKLRLLNIDPNVIKKCRNSYAMPYYSIAYSMRNQFFAASDPQETNFHSPQRTNITNSNIEKRISYGNQALNRRIDTNESNGDSFYEKRLRPFFSIVDNADTPLLAVDIGLVTTLQRYHAPSNNHTIALLRKAVGMCRSRYHLD